MVHKKSEYNLQFHFMPKDLRHQIWQENIKFRESQRSVNQAHHYWSYQITNEPCDCDEVNEDCRIVRGEKQGEAAETRSEHSRKTADLHGIGQEEAASRKLKSSSARQVKLREPDELEAVAREVAVQTPDWSQAAYASKGNKPSPELHHLMENLSTRGDVGEEKGKQSCDSLAVPQVLKTPPLYRSLDSVDLPRAHSQSAKSRLQSVGEVPKRFVPSCFSSPSRTSRKYLFEERKSPFASYGWNDTDRNIGEKKTYNVNAPAAEVHSPALRAEKRRREDILKYLAREADHRRSQSAKSPENLSSSWMSEYQDKYSHGYKMTRPVSAPLFRSSLNWR